jgi:hypothetical protein
VYPISVHLLAVYLIDAHLTRSTSYLMGLYLIGVYFMGVYLVGMCLMDVYLLLSPHTSNTALQPSKHCHSRTCLIKRLSIIEQDDTPMYAITSRGICLVRL